MLRMSYFLLVVPLLSGVLSSCGPTEPEPLEIDFSVTSSWSKSTVLLPSESPLRVAVASMTSPRETWIYYEQLFHYLSERLDRPVRIIQRRTYKEVNDLLIDQQIDLAFICSGAYVDAVSRAPVEIIAIPVIGGKSTYQAYVIVGSDNDANRFPDLKELSFAFTDPMSNTGYYHALRRLKELGTSPQQFFRSTLFTYGHDYSIKAVARGTVDAATVDGLILDYMRARSPEQVRGVRVIERSRPYGMPPVVVRADLDPELKETLRREMLRLGGDGESAAILRSLMIDQFVPGDPDGYEGIAFFMPEQASLDL